MRIGIDASRAFTAQPTGTERYSWEMITHFLVMPEAREHEWILYVKSNYQLPITNYQSIFKSTNVQIVKITLPRLWTQVGLAVRTWMDRLDVLWVPAHTLPVFRKPRLKTIVTIHGIEYEWLPAYENKLQRWYLPLSTQYAVLSADKLIAVSDFTRQQLIKRLGASAGKIKVVHEGVNHDYQLPMASFQTILNKYNLKQGKYLIFVGTVQPRKNLERLIRAVAIINDQLPMGKKLKLVIAGKLGWNYEGVVETPKMLGIADQVIITGYISDQERQILLEKALLYVQPSITEGFGLPILEAWKAKLPVVSSNGGALAEVAGRAAVLFDPENIRWMAEAIKSVIVNPNLRKDLVSRGQKRLGLFTWEAAAEQTLRILVS